MSETTIPMTPLYDGHAKVYDRYCELRGEEWVERVDRETSVYEFVLAFIHSNRQHERHETDDFTEILR